MSESKTLAESLDVFVDDRMRGLRVSMPGRVESYDKDTQKANVQPIIQQGYIKEDGTRGSKALAMVLDVPIQFQGSGAFGMTFPVSKGDIVLLVFSDFSLDKWLALGAPENGTTDSGDDRAHALSDAFAIPGLRDFNDPTDQVSTDSNVIRGKTRIGSKDASEALLLGDSYASAESTWMDALNTYLAAVATATATGAAHATFITATAAFKTATTAAKATKALAE